MPSKVGTVIVDATAQRVFDYFAAPRNLIMANNPGPVVDRSDPSEGPGAWAMVKFDQLGVRVEYEDWVRPNRLAGVVRYSGFGSGDRTDRFAYDFEDSGGRTVVRYERSFGGPFRIPFVTDWLDRRYWVNVSRRLAGTNDVHEL